MLRAATVAIAFGCGSSPPPVSPPSPRVQVPRCGYDRFVELEAAAWRAAHESAPDVGSCKLQAIAGQTYVLRDGDTDVAKLTRHGTMMLVPGMSVGGFRVGESSDVVLRNHPPDQFRISCFEDELGSQCVFRSIGGEGDPRHTFAVAGDPRGRLEGIAAFEFFRDKSLIGIQLTRPGW